MLASDTLNHQSVSSISFQVFKEHALSPYMVKTLGFGISETQQGWMVRLEPSDLIYVGNIYVQLSMLVNGKRRVQPVSSHVITPLKIR